MQLNVSPLKIDYNNKSYELKAKSVDMHTLAYDTVSFKAKQPLADNPYKPATDFYGRSVNRLYKLAGIDSVAFLSEPYDCKESMKKIKALKGSPVEKADGIKSIFLEEMGFNPKSVPLEVKKFEDSRNYYDLCFDLPSGRVIINENSLPTLGKNPQLMAPLIRHELDHFEKLAQLCKSIGIDEFEALITDYITKAKTDMIGEPLKFNREFWEKTSKDADITNFDPKKYIKGVKMYGNSADISEIPPYHNYMILSMYKKNPMEVDAYGVQYSVERDTQGVSITTDYIPKYFDEIDKKLDALVEKNPELEGDKGILFGFYYNTALITSGKKTAKLFTKITNTPTPKAKDVQNFQKRVTKKLQLINSNENTLKKGIVERNVLKEMSDLVHENPTKNEIFGMYNNVYADFTASMKIAADEQLPELKKNLIRTCDSFVKFIEKNPRSEEPANAVLILRTKIHCYADISVNNTDEEILAQIRPEDLEKFLSQEYLVKHCEESGEDPRQIVCAFLKTNPIARETQAAG